MSKISMKGKERLRILSEYAAGRLSREETQKLMEAALEDQELFEAVVRDQPLADLMKDATARAEIRSALERPQKTGYFNWMLRPWPISAAAMAMVAVMAAMMVYYLEPGLVPDGVSRKEDSADLLSAATPSQVSPLEEQEAVVPSLKNQTTPGKKDRPLVAERQAVPQKAAPLDSISAERQWKGTLKMKEAPDDQPAASREVQSGSEGWRMQETSGKVEQKTDQESKTEDVKATGGVGKAEEDRRMGPAARFTQPSAVLPAQAGNERIAADGARVEAIGESHATYQKTPQSPGQKEKALLLAPQKIRVDGDRPAAVVKDKLSCQVWHRDPQGRFREVSGTTLFKPGDVIRLVFHADAAGYLVLTEQQENGTWKLLYPEPDEEASSLAAGSTFFFPNGKRSEIILPRHSLKMKAIYSSDPLPVDIGPDGLLKTSGQATAIEIHLLVSS